MPLRTETKTIGDHEYMVRQLNAMQGRNAFLRFAKLAAPFLEKAFGGKSELDEESAKSGISKEKFIAAAASAITNVSQEDQDFFCDIFSNATNVVMIDEKTGERKTPTLASIYMLHFAGDNLVHMYEWLLFCFEVNFGSFFAKLGVTRGTTAAPKTE